MYGFISDNADTDECPTNNGGCSDEANCSNTVGSFSCTCQSGYTGDGFTCTGKFVDASAGMFTLVLLIICPIAIAYSMGQIIKSICVCLSVCVSVCPCVVPLTVAFLCRYSPNLTQRCQPPKVRTSSLGVNIAPPLPLFCP